MAELYDSESNTLINNPNNRAVNSTDIQSIYEKVITIGMEDETIKWVSKNGQLYYEIKEPIVYKNPDDKVKGKFVLAEIDGQYRLFIVRKDKKAVAVPFGEFISEKGKSVFDYIIKNKPMDKAVFTHVHFRSDEKSHYMTKNEMKKLTKYYSVFNNSQKVGEAILKYLKEGDQTLDQVADIWSGSGENKYNFCQEIRAHADFLLDETNNAKLLKTAHEYSEKMKKGFKGDAAFVKNHYNSAAMADMSRDDKGTFRKFLMDALWGKLSDKEEKRLQESKEKYKNGGGFTR